MAAITIEYADGTIAHWTIDDNTVERDIEPILGPPAGMRC